MTEDTAPLSADPCEFAPVSEPWTCRVHQGVRTSLDEPQCDIARPAEPFNDAYLDNIRRAIAKGSNPSGRYVVRRLLATLDRERADSTPSLRNDFWFHDAHSLHDEAHHQHHRPLDLCVPLWSRTALAHPAVTPASEGRGHAGRECDCGQGEECGPPAVTESPTLDALAAAFAKVREFAARRGDALEIRRGEALGLLAALDIIIAELHVRYPENGMVAARLAADPEARTDG